MPFPLSITGTVHLEGPLPDLNAALNALTAQLERHHPSTITREGDAVTFTVKPFRLVSNWNLLGSIDRGTIAIVRTPRGPVLSYDVSTKRMLLVVTVVVGLGGAIIFSPVGPDASVPVRLGLLAAMWLWLFGGNFLVTTFRFPNFLARLVQSGCLTGA